MCIPGMLAVFSVVVELVTGAFIALVVVSARVGGVVMAIATTIVLYEG